MLPSVVAMPLPDSPTIAHSPPRRSEITIFLSLAFALMLLALAPFALGLAPMTLLPALIPLVQWVPALASLVAVRGLRRDVRLREVWAASPAPWRVLKALGVTLAVFVLVLGVHLGLGVALGVTVWQPVAGAAGVALLVLPLALVMMLATTGEELGWRGYLMTRWQGLGPWRSVRWSAPSGRSGTFRCC